MAYMVRSLAAPLEKCCKLYLSGGGTECVIRAVGALAYMVRSLAPPLEKCCKLYRRGGGKECVIRV